MRCKVIADCLGEGRGNDRYIDGCSIHYSSTPTSLTKVVGAETTILTETEYVSGWNPSKDIQRKYNRAPIW